MHSRSSSRDVSVNDKQERDAEAAEGAAAYKCTLVRAYRRRARSTTPCLPAQLHQSGCLPTLLGRMQHNALSQARNGEADSTPDEILAMVKQQAAPAHRCVPLQCMQCLCTLACCGGCCWAAGGHSTLDAAAAGPAAPLLQTHRLILFLQQSSVEWASSLWLHVVQELDPDFKRTVSTSCRHMSL